MKLASVFTDKMVLQRDMPIRVFGTGEGKVRVHFLGETVTAESKGGKWCVELSTRSAGGPYTMEVDLDGKVVTLTDVLIGDVFLACGQSNMEMPLFKTENGFDDSLRCLNENIRYFTVPRRFKKGVDNYSFHFETVHSKETPWSICDTEVALHFTAIGHYFAAYVHEKTKVPVGVISCNWGGKRIEPFLERSYFNEVPSLAQQLREYEEYLNLLNMAEYEQEFGAFAERLEEYLTTVHPDVLGLTRKLGVDASVAKMDLMEMPVAPTGPYDGRSPGTLWDSMLSELVPFSVRAVLWYQGEANAGDPDYCEKYLTLLKCLREQFACHMDVYAVELAPWCGSYGQYRHQPMNDFVSAPNWAFFREQQQTATVRGERNFLVTTQELGDLYDIHPKRKKELSFRLAKKVLRYTYGTDIAADQPIFRSVEFVGGKAYITLDNADGLYADWGNVNMYVAGEDRVLHHAKVSRLPDDRLCVYSDAVERPILVRYAFCGYYFGKHVYNAAGLPLATFRTDKEDL